MKASSEQSRGAAQHILTGQTRAVHGPRGATRDRAHADGDTHRWMSDPTAGLPAWIELRWDQPIHPRIVQLIFDTGLHRVLTLSHSDAYVERMHYGRPQPETVRDYTIAVTCDDHWRDLALVSGNYQRRRVHTFEDVPATSALRITVHATQGIDHARICEVRVYE